MLAALAGVAFFFLTLIPFNWHGGGGFIGNRYFVNALPALLFLVTRIAPAWLPVAGFALGGIFVAPILFTPFGAPVPSPTLQAHVRNAPFRFFPYERTLARQIPGYRGQVGSGVYFFGRRDVLSMVGESLWAVGGKPVEVWVQTDRPAHPAGLPGRERDRAEPGLARARQGPQGDPLRVGHGARQHDADHPRPRPAGRRDRRRRHHLFRLQDVDRGLGRRPSAPRSCRRSRRPRRRRRSLTRPGAAPRQEFEELTFLVGAAVTYLGEEGDFDADVYQIDWLGGTPPAEWRANRLLRVPARVRNTSPAAWPARGATRVALAYHWLDSAGQPVVYEGLRTALPHDVAPGETIAVELEIATPRKPGDYILELDALRERLAWFSGKRPDSTRRVPVTVLPSDDR